MTSIYSEINKQIEADKAQRQENKHKAHWRQSLGNTGSMALKNLTYVLIDDNPTKAQAVFRWANLLWHCLFELWTGDKLKKQPKGDNGN